MASMTVCLQVQICAEIHNFLSFITQKFVEIYVLKFGDSPKYFVIRHAVCDFDGV